MTRFFELEFELMVEKCRYFGVPEEQISMIVDAYDLEKGNFYIREAIGALSDLYRRRK